MAFEKTFTKKPIIVIIVSEKTEKQQLDYNSLQSQSLA